jgi:uncharacterized protein YbaP (TraB family)
MYFQIEESNVRLGGTMHWVPRGYPLAHWVDNAIGWARVIYLEYDKLESEGGRYSPQWSQPLAQRLSRSWPRIKRKYRPEVVSALATLRPGAVASQMLDLTPIDPGVERLAIARSREIQPLGPSIQYLETVAQSYGFADRVSDAVWDDAVSWALDNPASFKTVLESSYRAWIDGDFEKVERISTLHSINRFAQIKHAMLAARNHLWLPTVRELVQSANEPTLVLVGVAHLGGSDGLLPLLGACGLRLSMQPASSG